MGNLFGISVFNWVQFVLSILGITFTLCAQNVFITLVIIFAFIFIYLLTMIICIMSSKVGFNHSIQAIIEVVLGVLLIIFLIYFLAKGGPSGELFNILAITAGFILSACLFITAYEKT